MEPDVWSLPDLVAAAAGGDNRAWAALVDRYSGLVISVCRQWRLSEADIADASQTVWLRLVERLGSLREPNALPVWLLTTARNECHRLWRVAKRERPAPVEEETDLADEVQPPPGSDLLRAERDAILHTALAELSPRCRELLSLLITDPPTPYQEISARMSMPFGAIGPNRARCLERLRRSPAVTAWLSDGDMPAASKGRTA
jgi:RNA polymerase sigma factor (sigma-70 family)